MRQIKFKAKRVDNGEWVFGSLLDYTDIKKEWLFICFVNDGRKHQYEVDPSTVCQFTGLKDKNGVDVYEGDIVIYLHAMYSGGAYKDTYEVCYIDPMFRLKAIKSHIWKTGATIYLNENVEITGNIHDKQKS